MINGEPIVKKEMYIKYFLMVVVAMPAFSPIAEQTPNTCHSIKCLKRFIIGIYYPFRVKLLFFAIESDYEFD